MKFHSLIVAALLAIPGFVHAEVSAISIRVEQTTGVDRAKFSKTQEKALKIFVTNGSGADINNLSVKYYFFGHDVRDHDAEPGYGVQVFDGSKLVADYFSEPSLKENVGGGERK